LDTFSESQYLITEELDLKLGKVDFDMLGTCKEKSKNLALFVKHLNAL